MKRLYVLGYYHYKNTGDDAILMGLSHGIDLRGRGQYLVDHHSKGDSIRKILHKIWLSDLVILGGGTHMRNWGRGRWKQGLRLAIFGIVVRCLGKRFHMTNIGIDGSGWEYVSRLIAHVVTIRDRETFDSSILIPYTAKARKKILGVNLTPVHRLYFGNPDLDRTVLLNMIAAVRSWKEGHQDWSVCFYSFNGDSSLGDDEMNAQAAVMIPDGQFVPWQDDVVKTLENISQCSIFIGMRYHSCVFAYITGTTLLVIETYPSCSGFAEFVGAPLVRMKDVLSGKIDLSSVRQATMPVERARELALKGIIL